MQNYSDEYANDIADAAQWQLVKAGPATISRVFVYNNTTTQSIDDVVDGDKVSAYVYALQYVVDGESTNVVPNGVFELENILTAVAHLRVLISNCVEEQLASVTAIGSVATVKRAADFIFLVMIFLLFFIAVFINELDIPFFIFVQSHTQNKGLLLFQ